MVLDNINSRIVTQSFNDPSLMLARHAVNRLWDRLRFQCSSAVINEIHFEMMVKSMHAIQAPRHQIGPVARKRISAIH